MVAMRSTLELSRRRILAGLPFACAVAASPFRAAALDGSNPTAPMGTEPAPAEEITSNGVTWTFEGEVVSGTFVTGDPWIVPSAGSGATILSVTPAWDEVKNGTMAQPRPGEQPAGL